MNFNDIFELGTRKNSQDFIGLSGSD